MASIERRPTATGEVRYYARWRDPGGTPRSKTFARKGDAERHLVAVRHALLSGSYVDPALTRITLVDFYTSWAERQVWRPGTEATHDLTRRRIQPRLGPMPLAAIRRSHVETWMKEQLRTYAPGTVTNDLSRLRQVFKAAMIDGLLTRDPSLGIRAPRKSAPPLAIPSTAQAAAILAHVRPELRVAAVLMATAGLRTGEVCGLSVEHVDFLRRTIRIEQQVQSRPNQPRGIYPPKTPASYRTIPIPDLTVQEIAKHLRAHPASGAETILRHPDGGLLTPNLLGHVFAKAVKGADAGDWTPHSLRHFYASMLIAGGESVRTVQARMGHSSASITLNTYAHLWPESDEVTRRIVGAAAAELLCTPGVRGDMVEA